MSCDRRLLSWYRDGELSPDQRAELEAHLKDCAACTATLRGYVRLAQVIRAAPVLDVPPTLERDLRRRIAAFDDQRLARGPFAGLARSLTPAAVVAAVAVSVMILLRPGAVEAPAPARVAPNVERVAEATAEPAAARPVEAPVPSTRRPAPTRESGPGVGLVSNRVLQERLAAAPASIARLYRNSPSLQERLGLPAQGSRSIRLLEQSFQGGLALWRSDTREIYVLSRAGGTWTAYPDTWQPGQSVVVTATPPPGAMAPEGGFGLLWTQTPGVQSRLGWAVYEARGSGGAIQAFEHGIVVWSPHGLLYVLLNDGTWKTYPDAAAV